ncbi:NADPH-dependent oxidoreductase [Soehngenia longivitae]|uniref:NADPH-dependent oxidoreductase n=1 Tax=Soehngenia longivitae TaxID=2562294 RepID=A0A4Z0D443_9FIRM|nr:NAD(P)H-dependent oxidoreductase [Soehngenia longivitae]TFZ40228.1 NADPH-dependent oxidoreductase [Soehngenia longivitae]
MKENILLIPSEPSKMLFKMIESAIEDNDIIKISELTHNEDLRNKNILLAIELNSIGTNNNLNSMLDKLTQMSFNSLINSKASILIHSNYNNFTKTYAQQVIYLMNRLGCRFPGRPIVEANENLDNFIAMQKIYNLPLEEILLMKSQELGRKLFSEQEFFRNKNIVAIHSSNKETSNTLMLWDMVKDNLKDLYVKDINLGNGNIIDCRGCGYKTCKYFGKQSKCYYGGIIVEEVYPSILDSSTIVFLCPNYNDMLTANIVATINRLTALFRKTKFYDKRIFGVVVSGYSGSDALSKQLISSLNINKTFELPPYFSLEMTANDPGYINKIPNVQTTAKNFAEIIKRDLLLS